MRIKTCLKKIFRNFEKIVLTSKNPSSIIMAYPVHGTHTYHTFNFKTAHTGGGKRTS